MTTAFSVRRAVVLVAALCMALLGLLGSAPAVSASPDKPSDQQTGLSEFGSCLSGGGKGSLVMLMDQSGSLQKTDPDKARVTAAQYLAARLASFSTTKGITLDVRVAGFASSYAGAGDWTSLTPDALETVKSQISAVGDDIKDYDTDYWNALEGARQDLVDHDTSGCRAVAWLSDGEYDLDVRASGGSRSADDSKPYAPGVSLDSEEGVAEAERAGTADICRPTGVADQLRSSKVTLLGLGLTSGDTDFTFMKRIVGGGGTNAGTNGVDVCGDVSSPTGAFYPVSDIDSLLLAFDSISAPGTAVRSDSVNICQGDVCTTGESAFVLDKSLQNVHVLASSDVEGLEADLYAPGATEPIVMSQSSGPQTSSGVSYEWLTPRSLQIDLAADSVPTWSGQWRLAFVDKSSSTEGEQVHINLDLSSPLTLSWKDLESTELHQGETADNVQLTLLDHADGEPVDVSSLTGTIAASVTLTDSQGAETTLYESNDFGELSKPLSIPIGADVALGEATVTSSVTVTTASTTGADGSRIDGTTLAPTKATTEVTINPPLDFPALSAPVDFGRLEKDTTARAALQITGPGCVWVPSDAVTLTGAPEEAGTITMTSDAASQDSCVSVPEGGTADLDLSLSTHDHANGAITGNVSVMVAPLDEPDRAQTVDVPFRAEMRRPLDVGTAWTAFAIALLAGIGIPVGLLYLFKFLAARIPSGTVAVATTIVDVPQDDSPAAIEIPSQDWAWVSVPKGARELSVGGCTLRTRMGASPMSIPDVTVVAPDAPSISGASPIGARKGHAVLPLSVRGNWIAVLDQPDSPRRVTVVLVASMDDRAKERLVETAGRELATGVARIRLMRPDHPHEPHSGDSGTGEPVTGSSGGALPGVGDDPADSGFASGLPTLNEDDPFAGYTTRPDSTGSGNSSTV